MLLQFLIPQYNQTDDIVKPLLDSIAIQQNINFEDIGAIIVNDGSNILLSENFLQNYPFKIEYYINKEHKGVSATRNACLDHATAEYVMFCDADDMFFNACGLWALFNEMKTNGFDTLVSPFLEEGRYGDDGSVGYIIRSIDSTFVHGKIHRRKFLKNNNIRWNESLTIHEDSYFNCLCQRLATPQNAKYFPDPFYLWKWREDSVCRHDPKYILKTYNNMLDSNTALVTQFQERRRKDDAMFYATSMIYDAYFTMNKDEWINQENKEYKNNTERRFKEYYNKFGHYLNEIDTTSKTQIIASIKNRMYGEGLVLESITFNDWITHVQRDF